MAHGDTFAPYPSHVFHIGQVFEGIALYGDEVRELAYFNRTYL